MKTLLILSMFASLQLLALQGQVQVGHRPLTNAQVTLWADGHEVGTARSDTAGEFHIATTGREEIKYLIVQGPSKSQLLCALLGPDSPEYVYINEYSTIASVWCATQFLNGTRLEGNHLGILIASKNVPNFVDFQTGKMGAVIQNAMNGAFTSTMARFNTLASLLSACLSDDKHCQAFFNAAKARGIPDPTNTIEALHSIALFSWEDPEQVFRLLDVFYPVPKGKSLRDIPFLPYMSDAPLEWALPLRFTGGGMDGPGKLAFDRVGNVWASNNFLAGSQSGMFSGLLGGGLSKIASNGVPISPETYGYRGGGVDGTGYGLAVDLRGDVWIGSLQGHCLSKFDGRTGKPLSPPDGYTLNGRTGKMQGIIVTRNGDLWALDNSQDQIVYLPQTNPARGQIFCKEQNCQLKSPFYLAIDANDQIYVTNGGSNHVTTFSTKDPKTFKNITVGWEGKGIAIDTLNNAWVANFSGTQPEKQHSTQEQFAYQLESQLKGKHIGSITRIMPNGKTTTHKANTIIGPWGVAVDGDDNVWVASFTVPGVIKMCGARPAKSNKGHAPGDVIATFRGGGLQHLTDVAIDPAGNVWVANNWANPRNCIRSKQDDADSTLCGGNGLVVYYGLAKPVATPQFGPPRRP